MEKLRIAFRCDGSIEIGMGHIYRDLTIAKKLKEAEILFITRNYKESVNKLKEFNYKVKEIPIEITESKETILIEKELEEFKADILVTDIMIIKQDYFQRLRDKGIRTIYMDVIGESNVKPDVIINTMALVKEWKNKHFNEEITKYHGGPEYVILTDKFKEFHEKEKEIKEVKKVLLTFGGSDPKKVLLKVLKALNNIEKDFEIDIVIGPALTFEEELNNLLKDFKKKYNIIKNINDLSELHYNSDLSFVSGGKTVYESACVGTPSIIIAQNHDQTMTGKASEETGISINLGLSENLKEEQIKEAFLKLYNNTNLREEMSKKGKNLIDGLGTERIVNIILGK